MLIFSVTLEQKKKQEDEGIKIKFPGNLDLDVQLDYSAVFLHLYK